MPLRDLQHAVAIALAALAIHPQIVQLLIAQLEQAALSSRPLVLRSPRSDGARALDRLAEMFWVMLMSSTTSLDQRGAASEDFAPAAGYGPLAA